MAVAFGIEYGLSDIAQANAAITRELEAQKRLYDELLAKQGRANFSLTGTQSVDSNLVGKRFDEKVDVAIDKRIRRTQDRQAGRLGRTSAVGVGRDMNDILELATGNVGFRSVRGGLEMAGSILPKGVRAAFGKVAEAMPAFGVASALTYGLIELGESLAQADEKTTGAISKSNKSYAKLKDEFKKFGVNLKTENLQPIHISAQPGEDDSFEAQMRRNSEFADRLYKAAAEMMSSDPKQVAVFTGTHGRRMTKTLVNKMVEDVLTYGTPAEMARLIKGGEAMRATLARVKKRNQDQADYYDANPEEASKHQQDQRVAKWKLDQDAKALRDWSRS